MINVRKISERINIDSICRQNFPLSGLTTFRTGGPCALCVFPKTGDELAHVLSVLRSENITPLIMGGGANIVISSNGIPGVLVHTGGLEGTFVENELIIAGSGTAVSRVSELAAGSGLTGMEFIYSMPGSVGGAVWMNARCYERSISDILAWVEYIDEDARIQKISSHEAGFSYKDSIFQHRNWCIIRAAFQLKKDEEHHIRTKMKTVKEDRLKKGHFLFPCAGSVFKNNRKFGKPSGQIIDELGLKGTCIGDAQVADFHGNIIINKGQARGEDIRELTLYVKKTVLERTGYDLEPEILFWGF